MFHLEVGLSSFKYPTCSFIVLQQQYKTVMKMVVLCSVGFSNPIHGFLDPPLLLIFDAEQVVKQAGY